MTYTVENKEIVEPAVPEKDGYVGKWEEYTLTTGNITVKAVYTKIEDLPPETSETPEDSEISEETENSEFFETSENTSEPEEESKSKGGGCGGIATAGAIAMITAAGAVLLLKKKE